jgi:peptide-methionine (S)-S-oxide reductase
MKAALKRLQRGLWAVLAAAALCSGCRAATGPMIPPPKADEAAPQKSGTETAIFAGGCFWGTQTVFEHVRGVLATTAGYAGGSASTATYDQVTTETTGHAESVKVIFDPAKITYGRLLQVFFAIHDPTTLNRQGPDVGTSYRSAIFYTSDEQRRIAEGYIAQLQAAHVFPRPIVTQVGPDKGFYRAEDYHQDYALNHPDNPYIQVCDRPKIATLKAEFPELYVPYKGE